ALRGGVNLGIVLGRPAGRGRVEVGGAIGVAAIDVEVEVGCHPAAAEVGDLHLRATGAVLVETLRDVDVQDEDVAARRDCARGLVVRAEAPRALVLGARLGAGVNRSLPHDSVRFAARAGGHGAVRRAGGV